MGRGRAYVAQAGFPGQRVLRWKLEVRMFIRGSLGSAPMVAEKEAAWGEGVELQGKLSDTLGEL